MSRYSPPIYTECRICKKIFRTHPYRMLQGIKYCSSNCYGTSKKGKDPHPNALKGLQIGHGWNKGIKMPTISGKNHPNWQGGITPLAIKIRRCFEYKLWRKAVFERDNWTCTLCKLKSGNGKKVILNVDHHPKTFSKIISQYRISSYEKALFCKELWDINNGRTLCKSCHTKETKKLMKKIWKNQYVNK